VNSVISDGLVIEIKNVKGQKLIQRKITENETDWSVKEYAGTIFFITVQGKNIHSTKRILLNY
jgi:hypothetical protein